ncbi:MAG: pyridoxamine 5'-phosphate oxidase family protein [Pseudomonadota bacterium]
MQTETAVADPSSPFHAGEQAVQSRLGVRDIETWGRKIVRDHLPAQHQQFYGALPFLVVGARDAQGRPWATILEGPEGFVRAPDAVSLEIAARPAAGDALEGALTPGADLGVLGVELATRRRNRVNGRVAAAEDGGIRFAVDQTFGNCPQYIRERNWRRVETTATPSARRSTALSAAQQDWIARADTFFVATGFRGEGDSPTFGMDASHRGGDRGFVEVLDPTRIRFPDYAGNNHFNTIGNLMLDPRAGYLFVDFATGALLQVTGAAEIDWDGPAVAAAPGARRLITLVIEEVVELRDGIALRWDEEAESVRSLRLVEKRMESADVASFIFEARDGGPLAAFEAGQHLPIELDAPGRAEATRRSYSLSSGPGDARYRITVKREPHGLASRRLHDALEPGAIIASRKPAGDFTAPHGGGPLVLVSAGVGVTPMISMLRDLAASGGGRRVVFAHGARDGAHHPLAEEVRSLAADRPEVELHVAYSRPRPEDRLGESHQSVGRIDGELLTRLARDPSAHYMLCGPLAFMAGVQTQLEALGVPSDHIHTETFGPAS